MSESVLQLDPGLHNVEWDDYIRLPYMNSHTLQWGLASMKHLRSAMDGKMEIKDTPAKAFGRALHMRLLEPTLFDKRYVVAGGCSAKLQSGKRRGKPCGVTSVAQVDGEWRCGKHIAEGDQTVVPEHVITQQESIAIKECVDAIREDKIVGLFRRTGRCEVTAIADIMDIRCKCRLDKLVPPNNRTGQFILDVKKIAAPPTPAKASDPEHRVNRSVIDYALHVQAALYVDVVQEITGNPTRFGWLFVEDAPPYAPLFQWADRWIEYGRMECRRLLATMKHCQKNGEWPGYAGSGTVLEPPAWVAKRYESQAQTEEMGLAA